LYSGITVLNNPVYPATISLPFFYNNFYTDTTVFGANGDDYQAFMTAMFVGDFTLTTPTSIAIDICSDDDSFVYISGGVFGHGTLVTDNGGIHPASCTAANTNTALLNNVVPGSYTLSAFYADRMHFGAALRIDSNLSLTAPGTPEPATILLTVLGLIATVACARRQIRRGTSARSS